MIKAILIGIGIVLLIGLIIIGVSVKPNDSPNVSVPTLDDNISQDTARSVSLVFGIGPRLPYMWAQGIKIGWTPGESALDESWLYVSDALDPSINYTIYILRYPDDDSYSIVDTQFSFAKLDLDRKYNLQLCNTMGCVPLLTLLGSQIIR